VRLLDRLDDAFGFIFAHDIAGTLLVRRRLFLNAFLGIT